MTWSHDRLTPVDTLIFRSELVKVGHFQCGVDDPCFEVSESLDNDVFVFLQSALWIRRGIGDYRYVESGSVLLHRAGSVVERRRANMIGDKTYWFGIHPDLFVETLRRYALPLDQVGRVLIAEPQLRYRFASLVHRIENRGLRSPVIEEEVLCLFMDVCEKLAGEIPVAACTRQDTTVRRRRLADKVRAYVNEHLDGKIDLETVARATATSVFHLCRVFKEQTGLTLHAYCMQQRLGRVLDKLVGGDDERLAVLANEFGFSSHSHLCREFNRHMGAPPSAHRQ